MWRKEDKAVNNFMGVTNDSEDPASSYPEVGGSCFFEISISTISTV
jgi:hypothetical protein